MREHLESLKSGAAAARRFLNAMYEPFAGSELEFRCIAQGRPPVVFRAPTPVDIPPPPCGPVLQRLMQYNRDGYNIFYGVATRRDGKCDIVPALWVDIDADDDGIIGIKTKTQLLMQSDDCPANVIVDSGHGLHAYWFTFAGPSDHERVQDLNRALAARYGGDHVHDVTRVMRLPGTQNIKAEPRPCCCITRIMPRRYTLSELDAWLRAGKTPDSPGGNGEARVAPQGARKPLEPFIDEMIRNGAPPGRYPSRSEADFAVVAALVEHGYDDREIQEIFRTEAIGAKAREMGTHAGRYVALTIRNARRKIGGKQ